MQQLPKPPSKEELQALASLAHMRDWETVLGLLRRNADHFLTASCDIASDARSRQAQGAWMALQGFLAQAAGAQEALGRKESK